MRNWRRRERAARAQARASGPAWAKAGLAAATLLLGAACAGPAAEGPGVDAGATYAQSSIALSRQGKFRRDRTPADAPFSRADLIRNLEKVAFLPERQLARFYTNREQARRLSKWAGPIRYRLTGDGVRAADRARIAAIAERLARHTGLSIAPAAADAPASLEIFVLSARERGEIAALERDKPYYAGSLLREWVEAVRLPCFALMETALPNGGEIRAAALYVKAELENPWRESCLIEEFAQSLGLLFDHPDVRPSIFNDDQEFLALTDHDARLLEILYDRRLKPGMTRVEAAPIIREIVLDWPPIAASLSGAPRPQTE